VKFIKKNILYLFGIIAYRIYRFNHYYFEREAKNFYRKILYRKCHRLGENLKIGGKVRVSNYKGLAIGSNCFVGSNCFFESNGGITIGDNVMIGDDVSIISSHQVDPTSKTLTSSVVIESYVQIGHNCVINPGVHIKTGEKIQNGSTLFPDNRKADLKINTKNNSLPVEKKRLVSIRDTKKQIFVVSTGRSGSLTIASILNQSPIISAFHEPHWQLVKASTEYEYGIIDRAEIIKFIEHNYCLPSFIPASNIYVESDQKIGNLIKIYAESFPKSRFIWVIREPVKFVKSAFTRGWFKESNSFSESGRLLLDPMYSSRACRVQANNLKLFTNYKWDAMTSFEKCCWYWQYWNKRIESELEMLENYRWIRINIDDLKTNGIESICNFLNISEFKHKHEIRNRPHKGYRKKYEKLKRLSNEQLKILNSYCADDYKRWT
jgi:acetyltransferase-like isoleucine patch superfamily enzyme